MLIIITLSVIFGITSYVFVRGWQAFPPNIWIRIIYCLVHFLSFACFFLRMYYGDKLSGNISVLLSAVGFTWLIAVIYFALYALSIDMIRLANHFFHFYPDFIQSNYQKVKLSLVIFGVSAISLILLYGYHKFNNPKVNRVEVTLEGPLQNKEIKIVMASDLHLSSYINRAELKKYIALINSQNPDIVFLVGDIVDRSVAPLVNGHMSEVLSSIKSKYGVYAVSGNHEFYGGEREKIYDYIKSSGINFLKDSTVLAADSSLYIIGRDDRTNRKRVPLSDLVKGLDRDIPKILLDHQPFNLDEAQQNGIDLQLSGHTHNGQFWPGNLIVSWMFELPYGYVKKGNTHYYVSSGIGLWGPKYRIGTESEIVLLNLKY
ncbi:MAG: metallophosphoesterase [Bacteroidales bacterium]